VSDKAPSFAEVVRAKIASGDLPVLRTFPPVVTISGPPETTGALAASVRRRPRKPSIRTLIKQAEKAGKPVSSVTTRDGTTLHFGESESTDASNPWLADLRTTKQ
jgi:hypothetical protein